MGYTVYIDSNGDPQGNFTLLARRLDRDQVGFGMYPVGSFLLDHNDTKLPVSLYSLCVCMVLAPPSGL